MPTSVSVKLCKTKESLKHDLGPLTLGVICKLSRYISDLVPLMVEPSCAEVDHVCGQPCGLQGRDGCLTSCSKVSKDRNLPAPILLRSQSYRFSITRAMNISAHRRYAQILIDKRIVLN